MNRWPSCTSSLQMWIMSSLKIWIFFFVCFKHEPTLNVMTVRLLKHKSKQVRRTEGGSKIVQFWEQLWFGPKCNVPCNASWECNMIVIRRRSKGCADACCCERCRQQHWGDWKRSQVRGLSFLSLRQVVFTVTLVKWQWENFLHLRKKHVRTSQWLTHNTPY